MKLIKSITSYNGMHYLFAILYIVGILLFFIPITHDIFIMAIPYNLLLVVSCVFYYHKTWNVKTVTLLLTVFVLSIATENIGVATGKLFGVYSYGIGLGIKISHVPIMIGLNWVMLVYGSHGILSKFTSNSYLRVIGSSALMVVYDLLLEVAAPPMKMWQFDPIAPPIQNYVMWFILALVFQIGMETLKVNTNNKPGRSLFIIQMLFFLIISIGVQF